MCSAFLRPPLTENSRHIMAKGGLLSDLATTNDNRPYFAEVSVQPMFVLPYAVDTNEARFWGECPDSGYTMSANCLNYLRDALDVLY
jgi:hypothetical protein